MKTADALDRLLERFPEQRPGTTLAVNSHNVAHFGSGYVELRSALVALREELVKTRAEVDRLDGILGDARREAAGWRDTAAEMLGHRREVHPLSWELGAPAAGREEGT